MHVHVQYMYMSILNMYMCTCIYFPLYIIQAGRFCRTVQPDCICYLYTTALPTHYCTPHTLLHSPHTTALPTHYCTPHTPLHSPHTTALPTHHCTPHTPLHSPHTTALPTHHCTPHTLLHCCILALIDILFKILKGKFYFTKTESKGLLSCMYSIQEQRDCVGIPLSQIYMHTCTCTCTMSSCIRCIHVAFPPTLIFHKCEQKQKHTLCIQHLHTHTHIYTMYMYIAPPTMYMYNAPPTPTHTPFTPFLSISSMKRERYSGERSFRFTKNSKSYREQEYRQCKTCTCV